MAKDAKKEKNEKAPLSVRFTVFMIFVSALVFLPTTIIFSVCLIPTLVAAIVDTNYNKTAWLTVGAMNLAGTIPVWFALWDNGHSIPAAFQLVSQPSMLLVSYGGAAVGWIIYTYVTPFIAVIVLKKNEKRVRDIDRRQKELVKKWGEEVTLG
jgi:hypothetical protein